ncbi:MAG: NAD(P)-dependent oxidoreductase, partial [Flavobacteriales bacterium]
MRIAILDNIDGALAMRLTGAGHVVLPGAVDGTKTLDAVDGLVVRSTLVDTALLGTAPLLRFVARVGAGMENIDREACTARGIAVYNSPEGNRDGVGEWCVAQLLMLFKGLAKANAQVHAGQWSREANRGHDLHGSVVGIVGYGNMGRAFAEKLS